MAQVASSGRQLRLSRLYRHAAQRLLIVPLDHPVSDGPITRGGCRLNGFIGLLADNGVDAVVLHKGNLRWVDPEQFRRLSLIVHLSASSSHAPDPNVKVLVATVEEALRLGADAVSVHVNVGSLDEPRQLADLGKVAAACDQWNMPLLAMMYPRGPKIGNPRDPHVIAHAAAIAVELGADLVKTPYAGSVAEMADVVAGCPVPIVVAGGPRLADEIDVQTFVSGALEAGTGGVAMGRTVFEAPDPGAIARVISTLLMQHDDFNTATAVSSSWKG